MNAPRCPRCQEVADPDAKFCEQCGTSIVLLQPRADHADGDNTTRYLSAAVHRNASYCDAAVSEFLVEPVRALPPSPGADSAAILRDAVAAKGRRRVRDAILLVLLLIFAFASPGLFLGWLIISIPILALLRIKREGGRSAARVIMATAAVILGPFLLLSLLTVLFGNYNLGPLFLLYGITSAVDGWALVLGVALLATLSVDIFLVDWLIRNCFTRKAFTADLDLITSPLEGLLRKPLLSKYRYNLSRVARSERIALTRETADETADIVVHRGFSPFVGAGIVTSTGALAVSLVPADDSEDAKSSTKLDQIDVFGLHKEIASDLYAIRGASALSPGGRLAGLYMREQVLMSSEQLLRNGGSIPGIDVIQSLDSPPEPTMNVNLARELAFNPTEWARYYRCYRIETWDRDLTFSLYVHLGTDQNALYVERVHCVLMPLAEEVRKIDEPASKLEPLYDACIEFVLLPASIIRRLKEVIGRQQSIPQRLGEIVPARYGAGNSLRELASSEGIRSFFQRVDIARYQQLLDKVVFRAIGSYLEDRGYSVVEFQQQISKYINNGYDLRDSNISQSAVGDNASAHNVSSPTNGQRGTKK